MSSGLAEVISSLKAVSDEEWDAYILRLDIFYRHYTKEMCRNIISRAKEAGRKKAYEASREGEEIDHLVKRNSLKVSVVEDKEFIMPDSINFAEYHDNNIRISRRLLRSLDINKAVISKELGDFEPSHVLFYHELYHYYEDVEENFENAGISFKIKPVPFITKTISPDSAGEIAAYEFAKQMQKIQFHPYILGIIGLYEYNRDAAEKIMKDIMMRS